MIELQIVCAKCRGMVDALDSLIQSKANKSISWDFSQDYHACRDVVQRHLDGMESLLPPRARQVESNQKWTQTSEYELKACLLQLIYIITDVLTSEQENP